MMSVESSPGTEALGGEAVLQALQEIAAAVGGVLDPERVARVVVERAGALLGAGGVRLYLWSDETGDLRPLAAAGPAIRELGPPLRAGEGAAGQAFLRREPVVVGSYRDWEHAHPAYVAGGARSAAGVPLVVADRAIGALVLGFYEESREVDRQQLHALALLAAQAAPALEAARLYGASNRRRAEAEEQATLFGAVLEQIGDAVLVADREGRIVVANPAAARLFGVPIEGLVGLAAAEQAALHAPDGQPCQHPLLRAIAGERLLSECYGLVADGVERSASVSATPLLDADAGVRGAVAVVRDVTAEKDAERQIENLAQTERLRALGQLASGVAHDLSQSLALIAGYADLAAEALQTSRPDLGALGEMLPTIARAAMDGGETVRRLLVFARRGEEPARELVDVGQLLADVARMSAPHWRDAAQIEGRAIRVTVDAPAGLLVSGSPAELREALTNLVFNAVDALPTGGTIVLRARRRGDRVAVDVTDSGVGMPADVQARIFEPFFTTKGERGTGLGLAQVFGIVERHDGQIAVRSAPGRGTTFQVTLAAAGPRPAASGAPPGPTEPTRALRVLVVDDEPTLVGMAAELLRRHGHAVMTAASGEEALTRLRAEPVDVVVSDMGMGEGMNGLQLADEVRYFWLGAGFVLATGWGAALDQDATRERGVDVVVAKPYRARTLLAAIGA